MLHVDCCAIWLRCELFWCDVYVKAQIVCHPYFLSPGRHVTEDIPELVAAATKAVARPDISIVTTVPVGSSMEVMVGAISSIVDTTIRNTMEEAPPPKKKRSSSPFLNLGNF